MPCPHGCGDPRTCSQCRGAVPKRIVLDHANRRVLIDGQPAERPIAIAASPSAASYGKRGGAAGRRAKRETEAMHDPEEGSDLADLDED